MNFRWNLRVYVPQLYTYTYCVYCIVFYLVKKINRFSLDDNIVHDVYLYITVMMSRLLANRNNKLKRVQIVTIYTAYDMQWAQCNTAARRSFAKFTKTTVYADQPYDNNNMQLFSSHCSYTSVTKLVVITYENFCYRKRITIF